MDDLCGIAASFTFWSPLRGLIRGPGRNRRRTQYDRKTARPCPDKASGQAPNRAWSRIRSACRLRTSLGARLSNSANSFRAASAGTVPADTVSACAKSGGVKPGAGEPHLRDPAKSTRYLRPGRRRYRSRRANQAGRRRDRQTAGRSRPHRRASPQSRLRRPRIFRAVLGTLSAMRADHFADPRNARQSRPHDKRSRTAQERQFGSGRPAPGVDRATGAKQMRGAIHRRGQFAGRAARLFRRPVRRRHHPQRQRRRRAEWYLSHPLRAHLRRLLFPDLVLDPAEPFCRGRAHLPARVPGGRGRALFVSQSRRGHGSGGVEQRPIVYDAAERIPLSHDAHLGLFVPSAGPELGGCAQERRRTRTRSRAATSW